MFVFKVAAKYGWIYVLILIRNNYGHVSNAASTHETCLQCFTKLSTHGPEKVVESPRMLYGLSTVKPECRYFLCWGMTGKCYFSVRMLHRSRWRSCKQQGSWLWVMYNLEQTLDQNRVNTVLCWWSQLEAGGEVWGLYANDHIVIKETGM